MAQRPVILTGFHFTKTTLATLSESYEIAGHMDKPDPALVPAAAQPHVQALVTTGSVGASDALMAAMPRLSLICCYGTGYERIDLAAARKRNIMVTHGADANAPDVAEMAVGILLASTRRIVRADKMIRRGDWTKRIPNRFGAIAGLSGGKVGILGLGAIGMEFVKRIKGFDVEIGYCNRSKRSDVDFAYFPNVMALATWCDYLIVCLRSDASNRHIINAEVLKALGPRGHVLNISRGWAVDEAALADALRNNVIEGAALDVFDEEPYEGQELLSLDNLVMTPHFGGGTEHAQRRMTSLVRRNLDAHFAGKPVVSPLPELATWRLSRRVDSDSHARAVGGTRSDHEIPIGVNDGELAAKIAHQHEGPAAHGIVAPRLDAHVAGEEDGAVDVIALRHDDQALLPVDVTRPGDRGHGAKAREVAVDHAGRHAARDQHVAHHGRLVVAVALAVAAHDQVLDLAGLPQLDGRAQAVAQPGIEPARRIVRQRAQDQRDVDLRQARDVAGGIDLAPARHHLVGHGRDQGDDDDRRHEGYGRPDGDAHRVALHRGGSIPIFTGAPPSRAGAPVQTSR